MSTQPTAAAPDPITTAIADAILNRLDLNHLAARIADHLLAAQQPGENHPTHPDTPLEVTQIRRQLGTRGRPMAYQTFQKRYIHTGLIRLIDGPKRSQLYVRHGDWETLKTQATAKK